MKLTLAEPRYLRESINIISELVTEITLKITKENLEILAMDPANVAMIAFKLFSSAFVEYEVTEEKEIAINLDNLKQILRRSKPSDILTLELEEDKNKLKIQLKGDSTRTFHLSLIDVEEKSQKIPSLEFPLKIESNAYILDEAVEDVGVVAESVTLIANKDKLIIQSEGNLTAAKVEIPKDEETSIILDKEGDIVSKYSLDYLKKIVKGSKLSDKVIIQFNKDYPLRVEYNIMDKLSLSVILAPRVENN